MNMSWEEASLHSAISPIDISGANLTFYESADGAWIMDFVVYNDTMLSPSVRHANII